MRFYLDEDIPYDAAAIGRAFGIDATSSWEVGNNGMTDATQLRYAVTQSRCIVSRNHHDFADLSDAYDARGEMHAGILMVARSLRHQDAAALARALAYYARLYPDEVIHHTDWLHPAPSEQ